MMEDIENIKHILALDSLVHLPRRKKHLLVEYAKSATRVFDLSEEELMLILTPEEYRVFQNIRTINIEETWQKLIEKNINFTYYGAKDYPTKLLDIPDPPFVLYYYGHLPKDNEKLVGMIGARQSSDYGNYMARLFARSLAENGINVVSGMALGIDGISQREAIMSGAESYAVLGCGVDVIYPPSNKALYNSLITQGGIISEYPPGTTPLPILFPPRNRIISGLSDCILVVEAREKSGTLITVDMALEQGKDVFVIPGRCTDSLSIGCNKLIRNGASLVCNPQELMLDMNWIEVKKHGKRKIKAKLSNIATIIYNLLDFNPKTQDDIIMGLNKKGKNISISELSQGLLELELNGMIQKNFGQYSVINN